MRLLIDGELATPADANWLKQLLRHQGHTLRLDRRYDLQATDTFVLTITPDPFTIQFVADRPMTIGNSDDLLKVLNAD